jgi:hypothetical protein
MFMFVFSYIVELSFFCIMFATLKVYIVCVRNCLFGGGGGGGQQKKNNLFVRNLKKRKP